jgi:hypothetical protein
MDRGRRRSAFPQVLQPQREADSLTISGTSGPVTHTVHVTLVITSDFAISAAPASITISKGGTASYTVTITAAGGFSGTVMLSQSGAPRRASDQFSPTSVVNSGTSVLTIQTRNNVGAGTSVITITGTSGSLVHSTTVNLIVK